MVKLYETGAYLLNGSELVPDDGQAQAVLASKGVQTSKEDASKNTMAYGILEAHNTSGNMEQLKIKFDKMTSHDITFVGIIQTARASGLTEFPIPYVLTNCHNSLCAVGGTINEDDHVFGLSCAKKYGGIYVPPHQAVIHQFAREMLAECGAMILGSDSHTRYGALGTMAIGEGGGELAKQLLKRTYDVAKPGVVAIYLDGEVQKGVGPQDVALAIIGATFGCGYVKNKVMEFVGPGVDKLSADFRIGVDVMTTETTCLSSIWKTDEKIKEFYDILCENLSKYDTKPVHTLAELLDFKNDRFPKECGFFGIFKEEEMLAGSMMFYFDKVGCAHTQYLAARQAFNKLSPMTFMYYSMIVEMKNRGYKRISWGTATEDLGNYLNMGLITSKEDFGSSYCNNLTYSITL